MCPFISHLSLAWRLPPASDELVLEMIRKGEAALNIEFGQHEEIVAASGSGASVAAHRPVLDLIGPVSRSALPCYHSIREAVVEGRGLEILPDGSGDAQRGSGLASPAIDLRPGPAR